MKIITPNMPPCFSWAVNASGISTAAAPTWIASYGAFSGSPSHPLASKRVKL